MRLVISKLFLFGATVIKASSIGNRGITLGSYIAGGNSIEADPNNSLFQHEYGHYLQSQEMGLAYLAKVGIPSIRSAIVSGPGEHKYRSFERDANFRAFKYFNKNVDGFYESASGTFDGTGWNFYYNPLLNEENKYVDYKNANEMDVVRNSLSVEYNKN